MANQKLTAKQRQAKLEAAKERERKAQEAKQKKEFIKKVGIIVVCVVLVLALGLPTMALMVMGSGA